MRNGVWRSALLSNWPTLRNVTCALPAVSFCSTAMLVKRAKSVFVTADFADLAGAGRRGGFPLTQHSAPSCEPELDLRHFWVINDRAWPFTMFASYFLRPWRIGRLRPNLAYVRCQIGTLTSGRNVELEISPGTTKKGSGRDPAQLRRIVRYPDF